MKCLNCGCENIIKNGKANGKQTYLCKECFSRFFLERKKKRYPSKLKKQAIALYKSGMRKSEIAKKLNVKVQVIHYWLKNITLRRVVR